MKTSDREKIMSIRKKRRNKDLNGLGAILEQCAVQLRELGSHHKSFCFLSLKTKLNLRKFVCQMCERCKNPIRSQNRSKLLTKKKASHSLSLDFLPPDRPPSLFLCKHTTNTVFPERCSGGLSRPRTLNHWGFGEDDP